MNHEGDLTEEDLELLNHANSPNKKLQEERETGFEAFEDQEQDEEENN